MGRRVGLALAWVAWAAVAAAAPPAEQVEAVELHLPAGADASGLTELVDIRRGQRLSRRAVQRSIERLFSTGRFADVVVRTLHEPGGVRLVFELSLPRKIATIAFSGQRVIGEDVLRRAVRMPPNEAYSPERLEEAEEVIARAYREKGYDHARIRSQVRPVTGGVSVEFHVSEGEPTRLVGVSVAGAPGLPLSRVLDALHLRPGDILDRSVLAEGMDRVKTLYRTERFFQVRIGDPSLELGAQGTWLKLPVLSGPRFVIRFIGQHRFSEDLLTQVLDYRGQETLDRGLLGSIARKVESFYRYRGFHDAHVRPREVRPTGASDAALVFEVEEGRQLEIGEVSFDGNSHRSDEELLELVEQRVRAERPVLPGGVRVRVDPTETEGRTPANTGAHDLPPEPVHIFVEEAYRQAADSLTESYHEEGFLQAKVRLQELDLEVDRDHAQVHFQVEEGPLARVHRVEVVNAPSQFEVPSFGSLLGAGRPLRASAVEAVRLDMVRALGRGGWLFSQVSVQTPLTSDGKQADVRYEVQPGPRVKVGQVVIQGLEETQEALVRAHVLLKPGALLDPEELFETQRRLVSLGIFRQVVVRFLAPETVEAVKDVVVEVRERPRLSGEVSGGYSLADGPRVGVDAVYPNLFGQGLTLSGRAQVNYVGASTQVLTRFFDPQQLQGVEGLAGRATVSLLQQRIYQLLPTQLGARVDLVAERVLRPSYRFTRYAAIAGLTFVGSRWFTMGLNYELEQERVQASQGVVQLLPSLVRGDAERLRFPVGLFNLHTLAPSFTFDFRDEPSNPSRGALISVNTEFTKDLGATLTDAEGHPLETTHIFTFKLYANVTGYVPFGGGVVMAVSVRGGRIFRLDPDSTTIAPKRFFLGGATSMRGFREDGVLPADRRAALQNEVLACRALANPGGCTPSALALQAGRQLPSEGGELFTLAKLELRIPVYGAFGLGLFGEVGNLWLNVHNYRPLELRYVAGVGLRYLTPVGPLALDLGFNVVPDALVNENNPNVQFSVGLF